MELELHIALISNVTLEPYLIPLVKQYFGNQVTITSIPFWEQTEQSYQTNLSESDLIVVWLNLEEMFPEWYYNTTEKYLERAISLCDSLYTNLINSYQSKIIWISYENYNSPIFAATGHVYVDFANKLNLRLNELASDQVSIIDLSFIIARLGISNSYNQKGKYRWNAPYSQELIGAVIKEIHKQCLIERHLSKKCLILDCDNVLWGGILSEDGIDKIKLGNNGIGKIYQDFQRFALSLYYHGIILAICSKNELQDVLEVFQKHSEMVLREQHIACFQVNWKDKPSNIRRIANVLNIGLESMVFIDDSPAEIATTKATLPEVTSILFTRRFDYSQFSCFNLSKNINLAEVEKRNSTYRTNVFRENLKRRFSSSDEFISALEVKIDIHEAVPTEYSRISELTQRTNKCTNGTRYTVSDIMKYITENKVKLYSVYVSDCFSDLGLVGVIGIDHDTLSLFSLSCRAFGREAETQMVEYITDNFNISKIQFSSTGKNDSVCTFLSEAFPKAILINNKMRKLDLPL